MLTGTESTGKTTLAAALAAHWQEPVWVPEWARERVAQLQAQGIAYTAQDVEAIACKQLELEDEYSEKARQYLVCDTDLITCKIWLDYQYGYCPEWIVQAIHSRPYRLHVLCGLDVPWEWDPLREHPHQRQELYERYRRELLFFQKPFVEVNGSVGERIAAVVSFLKKL